MFGIRCSACCSALVMALTAITAGIAVEPEPVPLSGRLAVELAAEGAHELAAVEFRRAAMETNGPPAGALFWTAAHQYWQEGQHAQAARMLDHAEDRDPALDAPALLLRGRLSLERQHYDEAVFYLDSVLIDGDDVDMQRASARWLASTHVRQGRLAAAGAALQKFPEDNGEGLKAIEDYAAGRDKRPGLGGMLGVVPGLGYAYAGEYANAFRSLLLNGLFIFGMVHTAEEDSWGAFTAITFFELTWYSGSIYGGIDASHRYNRRRLDTCVSGVEADTTLEPDLTALPALVLDFRF